MQVNVCPKSQLPSHAKFQAPPRPGPSSSTGAQAKSTFKRGPGANSTAGPLTLGGLAQRETRYKFPVAGARVSFRPVCAPGPSK